jgi:uncharacterized protein YajQ (UPF0234 family)
MRSVSSARFYIEEYLMPSFDIVSEIDIHQFTNAVDQANRLVSNRFDFKGVDARFERDERKVTLIAEAEFQIEQMEDIISSALLKCQIGSKSIDRGEIQTSGKQVKLVLTMKHGIPQEYAKKIVKLIKDSKLKVQASIQGEAVRVTGKKRDDLQEAIALLRASEQEQPLQYENFRD